MPEPPKKSEQARRSPHWLRLAQLAGALVALACALLFGMVLGVGIGQFVRAPGLVAFEQDPALVVLTRHAGVLSARFVNDGDPVAKGQTLGLLEDEDTLLSATLGPADPEWSGRVGRLKGGYPISAPADGIFVARGDWDNGLGRRVGLLENLGSVVLKDGLRFEAHVASSDVSKVRRGQLCRISIWPLGRTRDYVLEGRVLAVSERPDMGASGIGYRVVCSLTPGEESREMVRLGMEGSARILVGRTHLMDLLMKKYGRRP